METIELTHAFKSQQSTSLKQFLEDWDNRYRQAVMQIPLFNTELTRKWSKDQQAYFAKIFYHVRGHFHDFLWYLGNHAPNAEIKALVLENIAEEFGKDFKSHEQLYFEFSNSLHIDLTNEIIDDKNYLPFIKEFNKGHLDWLNNNDWQSQLCAFSSYERLDNLDYYNLHSLVKEFGLDHNSMLFFKIHMCANHFDKIENNILEIWTNDAEKLKKSFEFIAEHQIKMWGNLSNELLNHDRTTNGP